MIPDVLKGEIEKFSKLLEKSNTVLLMNHIRMDPDAYGSLSAFYFILEWLGKKVYAINDEEEPIHFTNFSWKSFINPHIDIEKCNPDLIISLDSASEKQLWESYNKISHLKNKVPFVVIDHHITNPLYWDINIVDSDTSSACELSYEIIKFLWYDKYITPNIATLLLAWIHSDTNTFYNTNTSPKTLRIAADLIEMWARNKEIIFELFRKKSLEKVKLWWNVLSQIKTDSNGEIARVTVKKNQYENTNIKDQWLKWLINEFIANIEWVRVGFMLYEIGENEVKASVRCNDESIDVSEICALFWWGWHKLASGFTFTGKIEEIEKLLLNKIKKVL